MKARVRSYDEGVRFGIDKSVEALMAAFVVAMDDRGLCKNTIKTVTSKADFIFAQILDDNLRLEEVLEESKDILEEPL